MTSAMRAGRIAGVLFLTQVPLAPLVNFRLMRPGTATEFLVSAAGSATSVRIGALLLRVIGSIPLGVAIVCAPIFRRHSERMAIGFLALGIAAACTVAMESVAVPNMLSLSAAYAKAAVPLAGFGVVSALVSIAAATMPLLGYRFSFLLLTPIGLSQLALVAWLIARGMTEQPHAPHGSGAGAGLATA